MTLNPRGIKTEYINMITDVKISDDLETITL